MTEADAVRALGRLPPHQLVAVLRRLIRSLPRSAAARVGWRIAAAADDPADQSNTAQLGRMMRAEAASVPRQTYDPRVFGNNLALIGAIVCGLVPREAGP